MTYAEQNGGRSQSLLAHQSCPSGEILALLGWEVAAASRSPHHVCHGQMSADHAASRRTDLKKCAASVRALSSVYAPR
eukprot:6897782-Alexandrium_andersonii.AAC.1